MLMKNELIKRLFKIPTGEELKKLRKESKLTQKKLADLAGVSQSLIARIENNDVDPKTSTLRKILTALESVRSDKMLAIEYASKQVLHISPDETVGQAAELMIGESISQLPVVDKQNRVIGAVRERTISTLVLEHGKKILDDVVEEYVEESFPQFAAKSVTIGEISKLILEHDAILLMDKGKIAGIITKADIVRSAVE